MCKQVAPPKPGISTNQVILIGVALGPSAIQCHVGDSPPQTWGSRGGLLSSVLLSRTCGLPGLGLNRPLPNQQALVAMDTG